jgi:hypothetical protein
MRNLPDRKGEHSEQETKGTGERARHETSILQKRGIYQLPSDWLSILENVYLIN